MVGLHSIISIVVCRTLLSGICIRAGAEEVQSMEEISENCKQKNNPQHADQSILKGYLNNTTMLFLSILTDNMVFVKKGARKENE